MERDCCYLAMNYRRLRHYSCDDSNENARKISWRFSLNWTTSFRKDYNYLHEKAKKLIRTFGQRLLAFTTHNSLGPKLEHEFDEVDSTSAGKESTLF